MIISIEWLGFHADYDHMEDVNNFLEYNDLERCELAGIDETIDAIWEAVENESNRISIPINSNQDMTVSFTY